MRVSLAKLGVGESGCMPLDMQQEFDSVSYRGDTLTFAKPVHIQGEVRRDGRRVIVNGSLETALRFVCHRCLKEAERDFSVEVEEVFSETPDTEEGEYGFHGSTIELDTMLMDVLLLQLPQLVCSDDCRGLCPVCGVDRNVQECSCQKELEEEHAGPFAALHVLLSEKEETNNGFTES